MDGVLMGVVFVRVRMVARSVAAALVICSFAFGFELLRSPGSSVSSGRAGSVVRAPLARGTTERPGSEESPAEAVRRLRDSSLMRVFVDPETGELISRPQGRRALSAAADDSGSGELVEIPSPYGGFMVDAGRRAWQSVRIARREDGTVGSHCGAESDQDLP